MRTRIQSIVAAFVLLSLLSLVSGAVGCRSNGGDWYNPKTYSFYNPFKPNEAPLFDPEGSAQVNNLPSMGAQPDVSTPPGGYGNGGSAVVTQYGASTDSALGNSVHGNTAENRVALVNPTPSQTTYPGSTNAPFGYEQYPYQKTTLHSPEATSQAPSGFGGPTNSMPVASGADPMVYPGGAVPNGVMGGIATPSPTESYSPFATPAAPSGMPAGAPIYGEPAANQMGAQGFGASPVPGIMPQPAAPQGFNQAGGNQILPQQHNPPTINSAVPSYTTAPSTYPVTPQGFLPMPGRGLAS